MGLSQLDLRLVVLQGLLMSRCTFQGIQIRVKLKVWEQQLSGIRRCCFVKDTEYLSAVCCCLLLLLFSFSSCTNSTGNPVENYFFSFRAWCAHIKLFRACHGYNLTRPIYVCRSKNNLLWIHGQDIGNVTRVKSNITRLAPHVYG